MRLSTAPRPYAVLAAVVATVALAGIGCGKKLDPPPVEITFRESLLGAGKIVQIKNTSNEPLTDVVVEVRAPGGEARSFVQQTIKGYETLEIGWKKLGGWEIPAGAEVEVRAEGFLQAAGGKLPEETGEPES